MHLVTFSYGTEVLLLLTSLVKSRNVLGRFHVMYGTFWKIFFFINTQKWVDIVKQHIMWKQCIAFNKNDEWLKILGRIVPFVRDTKCSVSRTNGTILSNVCNYASFLLIAIHFPDSTQWKPSHDVCCLMMSTHFWGIYKEK